ncbi:hypothetical protein BJX76DRAFT_321099 [Aspergillus varians]
MLAWLAWLAGMEGYPRSLQETEFGPTKLGPVSSSRLKQTNLANLLCFPQSILVCVSLELSRLPSCPWQAMHTTVPTKTIHLY